MQQKRARVATFALCSTVHVVAINRGLASDRSARRVATRASEQLTGYIPAEYVAVDQTLNCPQPPAVWPLDLASHFSSFLLQYPPCRSFQRRGTTTERGHDE